MQYMYSLQFDQQTKYSYEIAIRDMIKYGTGFGIRLYFYKHFSTPQTFHKIGFNNTFDHSMIRTTFM